MLSLLAVFSSLFLRMPLSLSLSFLTVISPSGPRLRLPKWVHSAFFIGAKDDAGGDDNWRYKSCKAPVKSSPSTNRFPAFYRLDALCVTQPTVSEHWRVHKNTKLYSDISASGKAGYNWQFYWHLENMFFKVNFTDKFWCFYVFNAAAEPDDVNVSWGVVHCCVCMCM